MAAKSLLQVSEPRNLSFGTTNYIAFGTGRCIESTTEANRQVPVRVAGRITKLLLKSTGNSLDGTSVITLRKNGAATALTITVAAAVSGEFTDPNHFVDVVAGDLLCYQVVTNGTTGLLTVTALSVLFEVTGQSQGTTVSILVCCTTASTTGNAVTRFGQVVGDVDLTGTTEADKKIKIHTAGTMRYLGIYVSANARSTSTTLTLRVNGANGSSTKSVGAGVTGWQEDTVNTDTINSGDDVNWQIVTGASTENLTVEMIVMTFITTTNKFVIGTAIGAGQSINFNTTTYTTCGGMHFSTTEANRNPSTRVRLVVTGLYSYVSANTIATSASTVTLRAGKGNSALSVSFAAGGTGAQSDTSDVVGLSPQDTAEFQVATPNTSGALTIKSIMMVCEFLETKGRQVIGGIDGISTAKGKNVSGLRPTSYLVYPV